MSCRAPRKGELAFFPSPAAWPFPALVSALLHDTLIDPRIMRVASAAVLRFPDPACDFFHVGRYFSLTGAVGHVILAVYANFDFGN